MTLRLRAAALLVTLAALATLGCGGRAGGGSAVTGQEIGFEQLARSASTSAEAKSGRFAFDMSMSFPGADEPFAFSGKGAFDAGSKRASFEMDMSSLVKLLGGLFAGMAGPGAKDAPDFEDPSLWQIEAVQDGTVTYVRFPALQKQLPPGKTWIRADARHVAGTGFDFAQFDQLAKNDPRSLLDLLREASGRIETVGSDELRGVETTHYRATVDPVEYVKRATSDTQQELGSLVEQLTAQSGLGEMPVDVWLDEDGLVRKLAMAFSATQPGSSEESSVSVTFELYDYGENVDIELPSPSDVVDASALRS